MYRDLADPGHGGTDRLNTGLSGVYVEADGTLAIAKSYRERMQQYEGIETELTRYNDSSISLYNRGNMAITYDQFISFHTNGFSDPKVRGVEVFYSVDIPGDNKLARAISSALAAEFDTIDRGAKVWASSTHTSTGDDNPQEDHLTVIDRAQDVGCPHVLLIEALFHSNPEEEQILLNPRNLKRIGLIVADIVAAHYGLNCKDEVPDMYRDSWEKAILAEVEDGEGPNEVVTSAKLMKYLDKCGVLDQIIAIKGGN